MQIKVLKSYFSLFILILISLVPIFVLYADWPRSQILYPWPMLFYTLGKITALIGLSSFALTLLLSARFIWLDKLFDGLPKVINIHRYLGVISFTLIILHPLFLAARLLPVDSQLAFGMFSSWSEVAFVFGYISLLLFMTLVIMTFFWRLRYERLKSLHSLLALPLMLGAIHALLIDSDVKRTPFLGIYYIILISVSVLAYLIRLFLIDHGIKAQRFSIIKTEQANPNIIQLTLKPEQKIINARAGQFVFVSFPDLKKGEEHPFSVAEIKADHSLVIITKVLGDYTNKMTTLKTGALAMLDGPYGSFGANANNNCHQVWLAGGIGITPFIGLAKSFAADNKAQGQVDLFYIVNTENDLAGLETLKQVAANCPRFKLTTYVSTTEGRFDMGKLKYFVNEGLEACHFYICGPTGMINYFVDSLKKSKIPKNHINIEAFKLL